jgi:serine phosphatase RsbU (regulator of sigma subunit)
MELAKRIQTVLLPVKPEITGYEITAYMMPADEVGGDYYDVINVDGKNWIVIGDVSGHGVPAGLIMMMVQTSIHTALSGSGELQPSALLARVNRVISENIKKLGEDKYMTITVFACLDNGRMYFSGLHQDIMIYRASDKSVDYVETDGTWIGIVDDIRGMVDDKNFTLSTGDVMLVFTDGITEAWRSGTVANQRDAGADMFGNDRLAEILRLNGEKTPEEIKNTIINELNGYRTNDDVTLLIAKRTG